MMLQFLMRQLLLLLPLLLMPPTVFTISQRSFTIDYKNDRFLKDGQPFQYISGSVHYFRIPQQYWRDRLLKLKAAGLNSVQIYVPWNLHEPVEGSYNFQDLANLEEFLQLTKELQLLTIVRAGPYICAEWDFGGLPAWLLKKNSTMKLRSSDQQFLLSVDNWMAKLLPILSKHLYSSGGTIIMVQLENEYGSTGECDVKYIQHLYNLGRKYLGGETILFTTDGAGEAFLKCVKKVGLFFATVDFGVGGANNLTSTFASLRSVQPHGPLVNSEFYTGWLDNWRSSSHSRVDAQSVANSLLRQLRYGVSVNLYMFAGGTNFDFWNGANSPPYSPQPTSYDYDGVIGENGDVGWKWQIVREIVKNFTSENALDSDIHVENATRVQLGRVDLQLSFNLFTHLQHLIVNQTTSKQPATMESLGQYSGFTLYKNSLPSKIGSSSSSNSSQGIVNSHFALRLPNLADFAYAFVSNRIQPWRAKFIGIVPYWSANKTLEFTTDSADFSENSLLWLLVENCGHVNYGGMLQGDVKGLGDNVTLNNLTLYGWDSYAIDFDRIVKMNLWRRLRPQLHSTGIRSFTKNYPNDLHPTLQGSIHTGTLVIDNNTSLGDTFANVTHPLCKGQLWINGFNLGRFWPCAGPQVTLFVPKSVLRVGNNTVAVLELLSHDGGGVRSVEFLSEHNLGGTDGDGDGDEIQWRRREWSLMSVK